MTRLLLVLLLPCLLPAQPDSLDVQLVFDGKVPQAYNRWLLEHADMFPTLWPIRIVIDSSTRVDTLLSFFVSFYDEAGNLSEHRKFTGLGVPSRGDGSGRWFDVKVTPRADRLLVIDHRDVWSSFDILTTVLDAREDTMFVSDGGSLSYTDGQLYFRSYFDEEAVQERSYFGVLSDSGRELARVHLNLFGCVGYMETARKGTHIMRAGDHAVVVNREGEVIWLDTIPGICETNIDDDALVAAALNLDWMRVKDFSTGEIFEAYLAGREGQRYAKPDVAIAERRGGLMVYRPHSTFHYREGIVLFYTYDCHQVGQPVPSVGGVPRAAHYDGGIGLIVFSGNRLVVARHDRPVEVHEGIGFPDSQTVLDGRMVAFIGSKRAMVYRIGRQD